MNTKELKAQMILKSKNVDEIAKELGISKSAFYRKLRGQSEFDRKEICGIIKILQISNEEAIKIFFAK